MFNKTYQQRASRGDLVRAEQIIEELVRKADADPRFYRPARQTSPVRGKERSKRPGRRDFVTFEGEQMSLFPCADLFPEAYQ